jgi:hypothetical protein
MRRDGDRENAGIELVVREEFCSRQSYVCGGFAFDFAGKREGTIVFLAICAIR